ncbi:MAG: CapA family protein [Chitinophagaceae bacterium]
MIKVNIVGDFMPIDFIENKIRDNQTDDLLCDELKKIFSDKHVNILNLECPLTTTSTIHAKTGKNFKSNPNSIAFLKRYNFKIACLANNHIMDYGISGLQDTMNVCTTNHIHTIGIREKQDTSIYRHVENDLSVSFINAAEQEFGAANRNDMGFLKEYPENIFYLIQEEKKKSNYVMLILHGGREFYDLPSPERQKRYRLYIDMGADAIVSHHTHVISGYEWYHGKPIVYSTGNFYFPIQHKDERWHESMIAHFELTKEGIAFSYTIAKSNIENQRLELATDAETTRIQEKIQKLNATIGSDNEIHSAWKDFTKNEKLQYLYLLNLFSKFRYKMTLKKYLKEPVITTTSLLRTLNILRCDAHREEAITIIQEALNEQAKTQ